MFRAAEMVNHKTAFYFNNAFNVLVVILDITDINKEEGSVWER